MRHRIYFILFKIRFNCNCLFKRFSKLEPVIATEKNFKWDYSEKSTQGGFVAQAE